MQGATKEDLRNEFLKPKSKLERMRKEQHWTTSYMATMIGLKNRKQYELKERGEYPFNDYEMLIIANALNSQVQDIFFEE
jgi:DNA-binding XRE family transcriptional regulator